MKFKGHASTNRLITTDTWWANITLKFTSQIQMKMSPCVSKWRFACLNSCSGWLYFYEVSRTCSTSNQFSLVKIDADMLMMLLFPYQSAVKLRPNITVYKSQITKMDHSGWWKCKILYCININKSANGHELQIEIKCCGLQTKAINIVPRRRKSFQDRRCTYAEKRQYGKNIGIIICNITNIPLISEPATGNLSCMLSQNSFIIHVIHNLRLLVMDNQT